MSNPFLDRRKRDGTKHGLKAEKQFAKRVGGQLHSGSGARTKKGDQTVGKFLVENKATVNDSIGLKIQYLLKVAQEAFEANKRPALSIQFVDGAGTPINRGSWVCVPEDEFRRLCELTEGDEDGC